MSGRLVHPAGVSPTELRFARTTANASIAYASSGRGPVLVRAAHWMTHVEHDLRSPLWGPWLARLAERNRLVRYDGIGHGLSDRAEPTMTLDEDVATLSAVIDAVGERPVALLGPSHGAAPSIAYAATHPERVSKLVILGGLARGLHARGASKDAIDFHESLARLVELGWGRDHGALRKMFNGLLAPGATPAQAEAIQALQRLSTSPSRAGARLRAIAHVDATAALARVTCPTLVLHSRGDRGVPLEEGRFLASSIPDASFVVLESDNHLPLPDEPAFEVALEAIERFLGTRTTARPHLALTPRERALAELLAKGLDNLQISASLGITEKTVRNAVSRLYEKLGVEGRAAAIVLLRDAGLGTAG
jgi:pimeloyl-ACP methyl ester carboxylesterase